MIRLILTALITLPVAAVGYDIIPYNPRAAGGSLLCDVNFTGLWCTSFEKVAGGAPAPMCDGETGFPVATGEPSTSIGTEQDCNSSGPTGGCPDGDECLEWPVEGDSTFGQEFWDDMIDDADSHDTQYGRFCFRLETEDADAGEEDIATFTSDGADCGSNSNLAIALDSDSTPTLRMFTADDFSTQSTATVSITTGTWHEVTFSFEESTDDIEFCVDEAIGGGGCVTASGTSTCDKWDGMELRKRNSVPVAGAAYYFDAVRFYSSDPGALDGC